ncbi:MAG: hypothetical protein KJS90_06605 [Acidobacteria bacterium]|nr:hypothetical protein [Acidobacteriota bacterium]
MSAQRILVLMGSGETAPTMVGVHRELAARLGPSPRAVLLDTPYGFQENAAELAERAVEYFATSVNLRIEVAGLGRMLGADPLAVERGLRLVADADLVFAGPGSPTYALRQWHGSAVADLLAAKLRTGGTVTFASAAALTLGCRTLPVYEVYKAGAEPHWLDGLDVLATVGISAAVVPHYNNAEGGHHDTRFCYMGERRLAELERSLPDGAYVLGIDEHTAAVIDLDRGEVRVAGKGHLTVRTSDGSRTWPSGSVLDLALLQRPGDGGAVFVAAPPGAPSAPRDPDGPAEAADASLRSATDRLSAAFDAALSDGDADSAARSILALDDAIASWSRDTSQSDDADYARTVLRGMVVALAGAATQGLRDPAEVVGPFVEALLALRREVRADKLWAVSDRIRDSLVELGVEVRDGHDGSTWSLRG